MKTIFKMTMLATFLAAGSYTQASQTMGKVTAAGHVDLVRSGVTSPVGQSASLYMVNDQVVTHAKSIAKLSTMKQNDRLIVTPTSKFSVVNASPLAVNIQKGGFGLDLIKKGETAKVESSNTFFSVLTLEPGSIAVATEAKQTSIAATSGKFKITDQTGVTRIIEAGKLNTLILGVNNDPQLLNVDLKSISATTGIPVSGLIAGASAIALITTVAVIDSSESDNNNDPEIEISDF